MSLRRNSLPRLADVNLGDGSTKRAFNRDLFREVAPAYDRITGVLSLGRDRAWKRRMVNLLPRPNGVRVCLDLACGTGDLTFAAASRYPDAAVLGIDVSRDMMRRIPCRADPKVRFDCLEGDMDALPIPDGSVDVVTGGYALRNAANLDRSLSEIARVLRPGGRAAFLDFSKSPSPTIRRVSLWILGIWGSLWGVLFHRNADVYRYLAESLRGFPDRCALEKRMADRGLVTLRTVYFFFGLMELRLVEKSSR